MTSAILGISAYYHDSAAAMVVDGTIVAAAQEERFTRKKHDSSFPVNATRYVLDESGLDLKNLEIIAFYDKPYIKFERLLETYHAFAPKGLVSFFSSIPVWIKEKLFMKNMLREELAKIGEGAPGFIFPEHHLSHAASAFFPSPFEDAAILTVDGVGEWATTTIGDGEKNRLSILRELHFPHSIGLFYSAFTYYCGFKVNSGEYKLMGLAPYGNPGSAQTKAFEKKILDEIIDIKKDGSVLLNMDYFQFATGLRMCNDAKWQGLFGLAKREPETFITEPYMNLALAAQAVTEEVMFRLARTSRELTGRKKLVMAGGVALNCVANGKLLRSGIFEDVWIQPAAGDAGGALGAALAAWHIWKGKERTVAREPDSMRGSFLGPQFSARDVERIALKFEAPYEHYEKFDDLTSVVAKLISLGNVVGWFQGRMEYGPRALGNRSILGDARHPDMQKKLNLKIKYREGFRPFAPSVLEEDIGEYFELDRPSPYMLLVAPVNKARRNPLPDDYESMPMFDRLYHLRSDVPAITHIDYSARIQSVSRETNERFWLLINEFKKQTGFGVIVNTSFNVRGEPIVCTPADAYRCFMRTEMDYLVVDNFLFEKSKQKNLKEDEDWRTRYQLD